MSNKYCKKHRHIVTETLMLLTLKRNIVLVREEMKHEIWWQLKNRGENFQMNGEGHVSKLQDCLSPEMTTHHRKYQAKEGDGRPHNSKAMEADCFICRCEHRRDVVATNHYQMVKIKGKSKVALNLNYSSYYHVGVMKKNKCKETWKASFF
ncbi:hypothetical protein H5410_060411 [Solanum commersonii]|uniref:Uncharacterized protein n=1 Tax=Solanum commersonii TaxID=4109 RepID=A0A9J5W506_SOLCO|nr:hypothetical protein H5410_060411 [Solanum commersonii]